MAKRGRKSKYATHVEPRLKEIEAWIGTGKLEAEVCKRIGIAVSSWEKYKTQYTELTDIIKKAGEITNYAVENALYKAATGYEYEETKTVTIIEDELDDEGKPTGKKIVTGKTRIEKSKKRMAPNTTAQIFWLTNRAPDRWQDKRNFEHKGTVGFTLADLIVKAKDAEQNNGKDKAPAPK